MAVTVPGAEFQVYGWGHGVTGGAGGAIHMVTRLDDDVKKPLPGMLRWALFQKGMRIIRFGIEGDLRLKDRVLIRHGRLTVDGYDAPGAGVCVRGGSLEFVGYENVILRHSPAIGGRTGLA
jgi:pectate lyase